MPDPVAVNSMFARIAGRYDLANRVLSGGIDLWWRRKLVQAVDRGRPQAILDLATGSGDVAFALAKGVPTATRIVGMDFCLPMLDEARKKQPSQGEGAAKIEFKPGDGLALPEANASYDAVTISFGLRNMADRGRSLSEMRRVLKPGGRMFVLEFSQPARWFRPIYYFYLLKVSPFIAGVLTGERSAYTYLGDSIERFPTRDELSRAITQAGFTAVTSKAMTFGIVALHEARAD